MARRGRREGATTEHRTTAPASSRPPRSARPGPLQQRLRALAGDHGLDAGRGVGDQLIGDVGGGQRQAQHGDHTEQDGGAGQGRPDGVQRAAVLHDRAPPAAAAAMPAATTSASAATPSTQPAPTVDAAGEHPPPAITSTPGAWWS